MIKINEQDKDVTLYLRDYLGPNERYPYDELPKHCEKYLSMGYTVSVISVPGFLMFTGRPNYKKPWSSLSMGKFKTYKTAIEALKKS